MKKFILSGMVLSSAILTGCVSPIGQEDFTCNAEKQGGICGGPREIYEITNTHRSVSEMLEAQGEVDHAKQHSHDHAPRQRRSGGATVSPATGNPFSRAQQEQVTHYNPRSNHQQTATNYESAEPMSQTRFDNGEPDEFGRWPANGEPLAPEPLAVLQAPEVMRVLIAPWTDKSGVLNLSSYVYVEVTPRQWSYGESANDRPSRVIPLDIRTHSQEELRRRTDESRGVSPLEVRMPMERRGN